MSVSSRHPVSPADLATTPLGVDELVVVVRPGHRWARRTAITAGELAATPLVVREEGSGTRETLDDALRPLIGVPTAAPAAVLPTTAVIRATAISGDDPAVLSVLAVTDDLRAGRLVRVAVQGTDLTRPLTILWRHENPPPAAARDLFRLIAENAVSRHASAPTPA
ncbi:hypothetical protein JM654_08310 [Microbacterium oxydans]|nr:hypothetical protein [Microbacterium oxydans]